DPGSVPITLTFSPPIAAASLAYGGGSTTPGATYTLSFQEASGPESASVAAPPGVKFLGAADPGGISQMQISAVDLGPGCTIGCYELFHYIFIVPRAAAGMADLSVVVEAGAGAVAAGASLRFDVTTQNHGPDAASAVTLFELLPPGFEPASIMRALGDLA